MSRNGELEKNVTPAISANDRRTRQSNSPRPVATGVARGMKPTTTTTTNAQRPLICNKTSRETVQGVKERYAKKGCGLDSEHKCWPRHHGYKQKQKIVSRSQLAFLLSS